MGPTSKNDGRVSRVGARVEGHLVESDGPSTVVHLRCPLLLPPIWFTVTHWPLGLQKHKVGILAGRNVACRVRTIAS